jgi:hypothetical protein
MKERYPDHILLTPLKIFEGVVPDGVLISRSDLSKTEFWENEDIVIRDADYYGTIKTIQGFRYMERAFEACSAFCHPFGGVNHEYL